MTPRFDLDELNLDRWRRRGRSINRLLRKSCWAYLSIVVSIVGTLFIAGLCIREDVSLTVKDFSINIVIDEGKGSSFLSFAGVVPYDIQDASSIDEIRHIKFYLSPEARALLGTGRTVTTTLHDVYLQRVRGREKEPPFDPASPNVISLVGMRIGILSAHIGREDLEGRDVLLLMERLSREKLSDSIEKVKIILAETNMLQFWLRKIFSNEPLFKEMGRLID